MTARDTRWLRYEVKAIIDQLDGYRLTSRLYFSPERAKEVLNKDRVGWVRTLLSDMAAMHQGRADDYRKTVEHFRANSNYGDADRFEGLARASDKDAEKFRAMVRKIDALGLPEEGKTYDPFSAPGAMPSDSRFS